MLSNHIVGVAPKTITRILRGAGQHWVGDGFPVRTLFAYPELGPMISPFLLLDYAGPTEFPATPKSLGVGPHPHRGFETVTIVYSGEVEHRDSSGGGGKIGPGDVQWMTAASGIIHEEFHGRNFAQQGGVLEMAQLWVNLPAKDKMSPARYQTVASRAIPAMILPGGRGSLRVIAGECQGVKGPAQTFTPINVWDLQFATTSPLSLPIPDGYTTIAIVLKGSVSISGGETMGRAEVGLFTRAGDHISIANAQDASMLLLSGKPIDEPISGSGPFVMNTAAEIRQAMSDYQSGRMGELP
jgi:redox-sensitive bicupin YhaK (pirin superfamily)